LSVGIRLLAKPQGNAVDELQRLRSSRKEGKRFGQEVGMKLEHSAVSGIGVDDDLAAR
jgi:hypothetical protein